MTRLFQVNLGVCPVEADDHGKVADFQEWQEVHADVPEINVNELRLLLVQRFLQTPCFASIDSDGTPANLFLPNTTELMREWLWLENDGIERELIGVFAFLAEDHGTKCAQSGDLPINVEHLGFKERYDVLRRNRR